MISITKSLDLRVSLQNCNDLFNPIEPGLFEVCQAWGEADIHPYPKNYFAIKAFPMRRRTGTPLAMTSLIFLIVCSISSHFSDLDLGNQQQEVKRKDLQKINGAWSESNQAKYQMFGLAEPFLDEQQMWLVSFELPVMIARATSLPLLIGCRKCVTSMRERHAQ